MFFSVCAHSFKWQFIQFTWSLNIWPYNLIYRSGSKLVNIHISNRIEERRTHTNNNIVFFFSGENM